MDGEIVNAGGEKANVIIALEPLTHENRTAASPPPTWK